MSCVPWGSGLVWEIEGICGVSSSRPFAAVEVKWGSSPPTSGLPPWLRGEEGFESPYLWVAPLASVVFNGSVWAAE